MIGRRILYLLSLLCSFAFYVFSGRWFSYILLLTLLMLPWLSLLISLKAMLRTELTLKIAPRIEKDSRVLCLVEANCPVTKVPFRCKIKVSEENQNCNYYLRINDPLATEHCKGLILSLHRPKVYDYLGLFSKSIKHIKPIKVSILPRPIKVKIPTEISNSVSFSLHPKVGGGFAENHEIRPYRPGDMLSLIHWKLSSKVDSFMVREPQVPSESRFLISLELCGTAVELDQKLGKMLWLSQYLTERGLSFNLIALTGNGTKRWTIPSQEETFRCITSLLFSPLSDSSSLENSFPSDANHFHIGGEADENI